MKKIRRKKRSPRQAINATAGAVSLMLAPLAANPAQALTCSEPTLLPETGQVEVVITAAESFQGIGQFWSEANGSILSVARVRGDASGEVINPTDLQVRECFTSGSTSCELLFNLDGGTANVGFNDVVDLEGTASCSYQPLPDPVRVFEDDFETGTVDDWSSSTR